MHRPPFLILALAPCVTPALAARNQTAGDCSLRFVHFGDAAMELVKPHWVRPALLPPDPR